LHVLKKHHLDKRAGAIAAAAAAADEDELELLTTTEVAEWLGVSQVWLEIGRHKGYGPPFVTIAPRLVRYLRSSVLAWLYERSHQCTREYSTRKLKSEAA
jgi:predicted DNA-binding transcriptional regulator AlpA